MASPLLDSICCLPVNGTNSTQWKHIIAFLPHKYTYNVFCLLASTVGTAAAIYQLAPSRQPLVVIRSDAEMDSYRRQNRVICWLAVADLFASVFVMIRSIVWLAGVFPNVDPGGRDDTMARILCDVLSSLIQYFYMCTYVWTFCYTVEVYLLLQNKRSFLLLYHVLGWFMPAVFVFGGIFPLYYPSLQSCGENLAEWLPHLLVTYFVILFVMVVNPVLYSKITSIVRHSLRAQGVFTDRQRHIVRRVRHKARMVALVFFVCWSPNIVEGILRTTYKNLPLGVVVSLWHYMAVVNPMQSFLNALVYSSMLGTCHCCTCCCCCVDTTQQWHDVSAGDSYQRMRHTQRRKESLTVEERLLQTDFEDSTEVSALLSFKRS